MDGVQKFRNGSSGDSRRGRSSARVGRHLAGARRIPRPAVEFAVTRDVGGIEILTVPVDLGRVRLGKLV